MHPKDRAQMMAYLVRPGKAKGGRIGFQKAGSAAIQANIERGKEKRKFLKKEIIKKIENFEKTKNLPKEKFKINLNSLRKEFNTDVNTIKKIVNDLPKNLKNKINILTTGKAAPTTLTAGEQKLFANNYNKKTISQMATEITKLPYDNKITKAKSAQLFRYYTTLKGEGIIDDVFKGTRPKGTTPKDISGFPAYRKAQKDLMDLDPNTYKDLTPAQVDARLKKAIQFSKVRGAFDVPPSLVASFEHFQGVTPGTIAQDPDALRKVGITTKDFNFNVLGAKAKNNIFKIIKNELRTAKESIRTGDKKLAKESLNNVNKIYDDVAAKLKTIDRKKLPKYNLLKNNIKETNIKPIDFDTTKKLEGAIEDYVRFVAAGPKKDVAKIKQPNLKKAVNLIKKQDDKAVKQLIKSRVSDVQAGQLFANPMFSPGVLGEAFKTVPTPLGAVGLTAGLGVDPTSAIDRASIAAEAAFAPALVKQSAKFGPVAQRIFNLGFNPRMAMRIARVASPLGIASLGAEGAYQLGKFTKKRIGELRSMTPEQRQELRRKGDEFAFSEFAAAGGGIAKEAGDSSGKPPISGPTPHGDEGLPAAFKRVKKG
jgi:hypothetical protein